MKTPSRSVHNVHMMSRVASGKLSFCGVMLMPVNCRIKDYSKVVDLAERRARVVRQGVLNGPARYPDAVDALPCVLADGQAAVGVSPASNAHDGPGERRKPKPPGAQNRYGSEGPRSKRAPARGSDATEGGSENEMLPDPAWVDIERLPSMERYVEFRPPPQFRNAMLADRERWAPGVDSRIQLAVATVTSNVVAPRIVDLEWWRDHVAEFFARLCAHRRAMHNQNASALIQLRERHDTLAGRVSELEERVRALERTVPAAADAVRVVERTASTAAVAGGNLELRRCLLKTRKTLRMQNCPRKANLELS